MTTPLTRDVLLCLSRDFVPMIYFTVHGDGRCADGDYSP